LHVEATAALKLTPYPPCRRP